MTSLYTGFKGAGNSSYMLVSHIAGEKLFLTNSYGGLRKDIENLRKDYHKIYMFGLDKSLKNEIRMELCAEKNSSIIYTSMDINDIASRFRRNGVKCKISKNPTGYLCNEAYYHMLEKYNYNAIFIHVPSVRYMTNEFASTIISVLDVLRDYIEIDGKRVYV